MKDFFDALAEFLSSDLAKDNASVIIVLAVALVVCTAFVMCLIFNRLVIPLRLKKSEDIMSDYQNVLEENERLKKELGHLEITEKMIKAASSENLEPEKLEGWEKEFLKKS